MAYGDEHPWVRRHTTGWWSVRLGYLIPSLLLQSTSPMANTKRLRLNNSFDFYDLKGALVADYCGR